MYIAGPEDIVESSSKESKQTSDRNQQGTRDGRTKLSTAGLGSFTDGFTDIDWALRTPA